MDNTGRIPFPFKIATAELDAEFYARAYLRKMPDIFCFSKTFITVEMMLSIIRKAFPQIVYNENKGDKHLHIPIQLKNADGQLVTGRVVPLKVTLRYCNGELVRPTYVDRPTLLQLMPEYPRVESDGTCTIKARIMQISRNHCNRHFILRIEPDLARNIDNCDIGYTECGPFEVRTKLVEKESAKRKPEVMEGIHKVKHARQSASEYVAPPHSIRREPPAPLIPHFDLPQHNFVPQEPSRDNAIMHQFDQYILQLQQLKWKPAGFETSMTSSGYVELTKRLYYQPPNPNDFITHLLKE